MIRTSIPRRLKATSFKDPHDFVQAMRDMNGKYIGSRPVKLRKSTWKDRTYEVVKKEKEKKKLGFKSRILYTCNVHFPSYLITCYNMTQHHL